MKYAYKNAQNIHWHLYTFVLIIPWRWNLGAGTCMSLCLSCVLHHEVHLLFNILIVRFIIIRTQLYWLTPWSKDPSFEGNCVQKIPPLAPILGQMNPAPAIPQHLFKMYFNVILSPTPMSSRWSLSFSFHIKAQYAFLLRSIGSIRPAHHWLEFLISILTKNPIF